MKYFADTETAIRWKKLTVCCPQAGQADDADAWLPYHQPTRRLSTSQSQTLQPPSLILSLKAFP